MLKEILSGKDCAECRVCCIFDRSDCWEVPLVEPALAAYISENYPDVKLKKVGNCSVFDSEFDEKGLTTCPMLSETGCRLGDKKPFDCRIWPFRVMRKDGLLMLTLSPVCGTVSRLPVEQVSAFAAKIADTIYKAAENNPEMIKDYIEGYPIFAVRKEGK